MFTSYAQNFEDVMLQRTFAAVGVGFYIDVGAHDPRLDSVTLAFYERGWNGVNVEPVRAMLARLVAERPRDVNLGVALGAEPGRLPFYELAGTGMSTLSRACATHHRASGWPVQESEVEVSTLAEICRRHAPAEIHFLKIDVEGAERDVLAGADFATYRPQVVLVEATEPNSSQPNHENWEPILLNAGYQFTWFDGLNRFYVAAERLATLAPCFITPPNVFDNFVRAAPAAPIAPLRSILPSLHARAIIDTDARVAMTARCRDTDSMPKVVEAGQVRTQPDGTQVQILHNGLRVLANGYHGAWMTELIERCRGHHEPQEERLFHEVESRIGSGGTMIELGGYWSYYSLWFLRGGAGRRAVVLEPDPAHRAIGVANAALNGLAPIFVAATAGIAVRPPMPFVTENSGVIELPCLSVPALMQQHGIEMLDILHCNIHGAELAVLEGCEPLFRDGRVRWAFVSTHAWQISGDPLTHQRCLGLLRNAGATIDAEHDVHESFSGDGLIVARFGPAPDGWMPVEPSRNRVSESLFRDLAYDLAERMDGLAPEQAAHFVDALYCCLLLRPPDAAGLAGWAKAVLERQYGLGRVIELFLRGPEFAAGRDTFLRHYGLLDAPE